MKQSIGLKSIQNARELGGYKGACGRSIKHGLLLRTAKLSGISIEDMEILKDKYHVSQIIDFRMPPEISGMEDPDIPGAVYSNLDVMISFDDMDVDQEAFKLKNPDLRIIVDACEKIGMLDGRMYIGILEGEPGIRGYREFFDILLRARPGEAVLWHCTAGKDRTGLAAMLLLSVLGVDEQTITEDYLLTNAYNEPYILKTEEKLKAMGFDGKFVRKAVLVFLAVDGEHLKKTMECLKEKYGSVAGYATKVLGLTGSDIEELRRRYLE